MILLLFTTALSQPGEQLQKGTDFPEFSAVNQHGTQLKSTELQGPKGSIFVIFRSADW